MPVIALAQGKGGAGKSTVAVNLAIALGDAALVDADAPQFTAASWAAVRSQQGLEPPAVVTADSPRKLAQCVDELAKSHAFVLVDCPARLLEMTRAALLVADLVLVPTAPTMPDLWAVQDTLGVIREARQHHRRLKAALLFTRYRAHVRSNVELRDAGAELEVPTLKASLGQRVAYADALAAGLGVTEWRDANARAEMEALAAEVRRLVKA
jgi:chromosome partitioning protein